LSRREGKTVAMLKEDHWCPTALMAYGMVEKPDSMEKWGESFLSFEVGKYIGVVTAPLKSAAFVPDVTFIAPRRVLRELADGSSNAFSKKIFFETLRDEGHTQDADRIENAVVPLPHICFDETLLLNLHPLTFEIRRLGGHSPACSVVYIPEEGILFAGDVVINEPAPGMRDANTAEWIAALTWIENLPVETIVPGHGEICGKDVVRQLIDRFEEMRGIMTRLLQSGASKQEAVKNDSFEKFFFADASRGNYWLQQRKATFREGLERLYDEVKGY